MVEAGAPACIPGVIPGAIPGAAVDMVEGAGAVGEYVPVADIGADGCAGAATLGAVPAGGEEGLIRFAPRPAGRREPHRRWLLR